MATGWARGGLTKCRNSSPYSLPNYRDNSSDPLRPKSRKLVIWHLDGGTPVCSPRVPSGSSDLIGPRIRQSFRVEFDQDFWKSNMADETRGLIFKDLSAMEVGIKLNLYFVESQ